MKYIIEILLAFVFSLSAAVPSVYSKAAAVPDVNIEDTKYSPTETEKKYADEVAFLVNQQRRANGLPDLAVLPKLSQAAQVRSKELVSSFSHTRPNGSDSITVLKEYGLTYTYYGENVAKGQTSPQQVMNSWMNSEGHRQNILTQQFKYIGIGVVYSNGVYYWTQIFLNTTQSFSDSYIPGAAFKYGDVNSDGKTDGRDATKVLAYYADLSANIPAHMTDEQMKKADVNSDSRVNGKDATFILSYYAYLSANGTINDITKWIKTVKNAS